ncbi:hypothetical protein ACM1RC_30350 [Paenibacillus azoreducens]|uniref:hypothetical protein n=1 Tax=Paenibacillus azoreducens TaxID=116718 RepID=UPI0039F4E0A5
MDKTTLAVDSTSTEWDRPSAVLPVPKPDKDVSTMYKETVHTKEKLLSAMDALEKLGKPYMIVCKHQEGNVYENIPDIYWEVREVRSVDDLMYRADNWSDLMRAGRITVNDIRRNEGAEPIEGGDVRLAPIGKKQATDNIEKKLEYLGLLERLYREGPFEYRKIIANRISNVCDQIENDLGLDKKETVDVANLTTKVSVELSPDFEERMKQVQRAVDKTGSEIERATSKMAKAMENVKVTVT